MRPKIYVTIERLYGVGDSVASTGAAAAFVSERVTLAEFQRMLDHLRYERDGMIDPGKGGADAGC